MSRGYYYMAANEDRVSEVMRSLKLKASEDPLSNMDAVIGKWQGMRSRVEFDDRIKARRVYFGTTTPGQRVTGMVLDSDGSPATMFTVIYGRK